MKRHLSTSLSLIALVLAVLSCAGVAYFAWTLTAERAAYADQAATAQMQAQQQAISTRTHAIIADTAGEREALARYMNVDVLSVVSLIQEVGATTGVALNVGNALPEATGASPQPASASLGAVGFFVEGQGKFPALIRTLQLLETLPVPATVLRFDLKRVPTTNSNATWDMNVYIRVLTTSPISS